MLRQTTRAVAGHAMRVSERAPALGPHGGFAAMGARHIGKVGVPENYGQIDSVGTDFLGTPKNHREVRARSLRPAPPRTPPEPARPGPEPGPPSRARGESTRGVTLK